MMGIICPCSARGVVSHRPKTCQLLQLNPQPVRLIHVQGRHEVYRGSFYGIRNDAPITSIQNPQANAVCKQIHWVVSNILLTLLQMNPPPQNMKKWLMIDYAVATHGLSCYAIEDHWHCLEHLFCIGGTCLLLFCVWQIYCC